MENTEIIYNGSGDSESPSGNVNEGFDVNGGECQIEIKNSIMNKRDSPRRISFSDIEPPRPKSALKIRNAVKTYGSSKTPILNDFSMTVQKGTIYSLLGSSGCGKTTLLSCAVGVKNLNSGSILVFGAKPGTKASGVPGRKIGYMPQETALYSDFSINEALRYYGTIYGMTSSEINTNQDFLIGLLDLPNGNQRIGTLSGGQKRRVSLAVSLVHSPKLLVLDEPTVGVDPLLRERIWNYLCELVSGNQTTVIITTHYIEEASQSNTIGLMRGGRLLAEESPSNLLHEYGTTSLEEIVLKMCRKDKLGNEQEKMHVSYKVTKDEDESETEDLVVPYGKGRRMSTASALRRMSVASIHAIGDSFKSVGAASRLKALIGKNLLVMSRNLILVIFMLLLPAVQVCIMCLAIGSDPRGMKIGVVNHENNNSDFCINFKLDRGSCDVENLSCRYMSKLPRDEVTLVPFENGQVATEAVKSGKISAFMEFQYGFSDHIYARATSGNVVDNETLQGSQIFFEMDMSNKEIGLTLKRIFLDSFKDFILELLADCGFNPEIGESPLTYLKPIYGTDDTNFINFIAPSFFLGLMFFFPLCSSSITYISDKKQGTLERARVAGVKTWEIMTSFFVTESFILLLQSSLSLSIIIFVFGITIQGNLAFVVGLAIIMGLGGISMGFLVASFCNEEVEAILLAMSSFFPNFLLAGLIWPSEGMPLALQYVSYLLPCTIAGESLRSIISRGWTFSHTSVWPGYATSVAWIAVYWIATIGFHKIHVSRK